MQQALTYLIEILVFAFVLFVSFDFIAGLFILWQQAAPPTPPTPQNSPTSNNIYNFDKLLALAEVE
ncbi:MAG: hypothetical protein SAK29_42805 [Scytonema sp. PMC 1069.18]|nr:hypothetical protein [Scytonema sp. PMC 1069.18]MEC4883726.1 hypothetical protein [Scytonema sp. PMC 1070.18]